MKYRIRFNKDYANSDLYWRVIDDLGDMKLVTNIIINVPSHTDSSYEFDQTKQVWETKWNVVCDGTLTINNSIAIIS